MAGDELGKIREEVSILTKDMTKIAAYVEQGVWYRKLVIGTAVSLAVSIFGGIYTSMQITYATGQYVQQIKDLVNNVDISSGQVRRNTERLVTVEVELKHLSDAVKNRDKT